MLIFDSILISLFLLLPGMGMIVYVFRSTSKEKEFNQNAIRVSLEIKNCEKMQNDHEYEGYIITCEFEVNGIQKEKKLCYERKREIGKKYKAFYLEKTDELAFKKYQISKLSNFVFVLFGLFLILVYFGVILG